MGYRYHLLAVVHVRELMEFRHVLADTGYADVFKPTNLNADGYAINDYVEFESKYRIKWSDYNACPEVTAINKFFENSKASSMIKVGEENETQTYGEKYHITFHEVLEVSAECEEFDFDKLVE